MQAAIHAMPRPICVCLCVHRHTDTDTDTDTAQRRSAPLPCIPSPTHAHRRLSPLAAILPPRPPRFPTTTATTATTIKTPSASTASTPAAILTASPTTHPRPAVRPLSSIVNAGLGAAPSRLPASPPHHLLPRAHGQPHCHRGPLHSRQAPLAPDRRRRRRYT